jgi:prepilin-type N-terminal cleavage/methylation domain-containing protein
MIRLRRRYTLQRIMLMIAALGAALGVFVSPISPHFWAVVAMVGIILVFVTEGFPLAEILVALNKNSSPAKFHTRYSLRRIMVMVAVMALPLAIVKPMYAGVPLAISLALLFVIEGMTLIELMVVMSICGVLTGLLLPAVSSNCRRGCRPVRPALAAPLAPQSTCEEQDDEPIMCLPDPDSPAIPHTPPAPPSLP